jgi:hypothetical protein
MSHVDLHMSTIRLQGHSLNPVRQVGACRIAGQQPPRLVQLLEGLAHLRFVQRRVRAGQSDQLGQQGLRFTKLLAQVMSHRLMKLIGGNGERRHPLGFLIWRGRRHVVAVALLAACRGLVCRVGPTVVPVELAHPRALERVWAQTADNLTALTLLTDDFMLELCK